ncbi:MAG: hypothetical protein HC880_11140 [Bacteroidia bacterium]|nr:hypothetical protein [Bacteroidia bacterium]
MRLALPAIRVIFSGKPSSDKFSESVSGSLKKNVTYFVRAFIQTRDYTVYGPNIEFMSLGSNPPTIANIQPRQVFYGETLYIYGTGFSSLAANNTVEFNGLKVANILLASDTLLQVRIPDQIRDSIFVVSVSNANQKVTFPSSISFIPPKIHSLSKSEVVYGDTLEIQGNYLGYTRDLSTVYINNQEISLISTESTKIVISIPVSSPPLELKVANSVGQVAINRTLILVPPTISSVSSNKVSVGDTLTIFGDGFGYLPEGIEVLVGNLKVKIIKVANTSVEIEIPQGTYHSSFPELIVRTASQSATLSNGIEII